MDKIGYDYSKFKKFGIEETDFRFKYKRASSSIGSVGVIYRNEPEDRKVEVVIDKLGISVGCYDSPSMLKNKKKALDMMYLLLKNLKGDAS